MDLNDDNELNRNVNFLEDFFDSYLQQLFVVLVVSFGRQLFVCINNFTNDHGNFFIQKSCIRGIVIYIFYIVLTPITNFVSMYNINKQLHNPEKEKKMDVNKDDASEISKHRARYLAPIEEAYAESQATCRTQLSFYLAFSYVVSQDKWNKADCIAKSLLETHKNIITFGAYGWHGLSVIAFSCLLYTSPSPRD